MKKMKITTALLSLSLVTMRIVSCKKEDPAAEIDRYEWENTLAGSIAFPPNVYTFTGTCTVDGELIDFEEDMRTIQVGKVTDSSIFISCGIPFSEHLEYVVNFYEVPVTGELMDVRFDCIVNDAEVRILEYKAPYELVSVSENLYGSVKGHVRRLPFTRDPAPPDYDCQMEIQCQFDGKLLEVNIESVDN